LKFIEDLRVVVLVKFINIASFFSLMPAYTAPALELMDVVYNQVLDSMPLNQQISVRDIVSDVAKRAEVSLNVADAISVPYINVMDP